MRNSGRTHQELAALAKRQHGVVSIGQLEKLGYSRYSVSRAAHSGRLHRLYLGVYSIGHVRLSWEGRCLAAVLACGDKAVASHFSAAWIWGLLSTRPGTIHVTTPKRRRRRNDIRIHFARLTTDDLEICDGIPLTAVPRTLLDQAASRHSSPVDRLIERAEERGLFDLRAVEGLLARAGGHPGSGRLRRAIATYREPLGFTRSELEERFLELVVAAGLPRPAMNFCIDEFEIDAYWQRERFAIELDVYSTHGGRSSFERDRLRQEDLKLRGIEMIRITGRRLDREPRAVVERIEKLLRQRRRQLRLE